MEGQIILGAIGATFVANGDFGPPAMRLVVMALASAVGGMIWIALPLFLKLRLQVNEIISTLLMNYIAFDLLLHLLYGPWKDPLSAFPNSKLFECPSPRSNAKTSPERLSGVTIPTSLPHSKAVLEPGSARNAQMLGWKSVDVSLGGVPKRLVQWPEFCAVPARPS